MDDFNDETTTQFLVSQAAEATFLFRKIYVGLLDTLGNEEKAFDAAIQLTVAITKNIAIAAGQPDEWSA